MWSQWSAGPPMPPQSTGNPQPPLIGPVQPNAGVQASSDASPPQPSSSATQPAAYSSSSAPSYTPAQYAAMTPEQQYAVQQHWQQWQAYEQQYAQWHAQYGEQYKREMAAIHGAPASNISQYNSAATQSVSSFAYPPPAVSNPYQAPPVPAHAPPPPPPDDNANPMGIKAPPQIYEQPPPPPPPPQPEEKHENSGASSSQFQGVPPVLIGNAPTSQFSHGQENRWSQPPPLMQNQGGSRWSETGPITGQQDRTQQTQFNQQFNINNQRGRQNQQRDQRDQQRDDQGRDNRQNNDFRGRGRGRGRGENNFENNRQQQFDDSEGRNNRQHSWQHSGSPNQRNNRGNFSNRFENYDNKNSTECNNQQGWNNTNSGNSFCSPENHKQHQNLQNQNSSIGNSQNKTKTGSVDEKAFDEQFRLWEEQFENWKKENANHPDRTMYKQYEQEFEKTRIRLLERREQMRRRKMMESQQSMPQQQILEPPSKQINDECRNKESEQRAVSQVDDPKKEEDKSDKEHGEPSDMEQSEPEEEINSTNQDKIPTESQVVSSPKAMQAADIFKNNEIGELFKTVGGGIPGLDLVGSKDGLKDVNPLEGDTVLEIIDLENDGPSRPAKVAATSGSIATLLPSAMQKSPFKLSETDLGSRPQMSLMGSKSHQKKIPSLFDIVVEKPILSPEPENLNKSPARDPSPAVSKTSKTDIPFEVVDLRARSISRDRDLLPSPIQRPSSQLSASQLNQQKNPEGLVDQPLRKPFIEQQQQAPNLPPQTSDLAKALQDPNVMQLLTVALAQAQQAGGLNQCNPQQTQLIQQLQQIQPLLQMQHQDRNSNNQAWNNPQTQRAQSWQNQNQNFNRATTNSNQNRNSWSGNPFNRNNDQLPLFNRGPESGNESDGNNDMQQRNPHNPFRRSIGGPGSDDTSGANNFVRPFEAPGGQNPFNNNNNGPGVSGLFGTPMNAPQSRGGNFSGAGRFDNNRPQTNFGNSLGFRNNSNNFGDRGDDDNDYYRPAQVFDYQNRSRADAMVPPAKVVDYGHRPSLVMPTNSFNRDNSEFVPVKTIDYGHASNSVQNENNFQQKNSKFSNNTNSRWNENQQFNKGHIEFPEQSRGQPQSQGENSNKGTSFQTMHVNKTNSIQEQNKQQNEHPTEVAKQINMSSGDNIEKPNRLDENDGFTELENVSIQTYPNNKWILQNGEARQRPGPPTKRGKRNPAVFATKQKSMPLYTDTDECDEIEENFEEISDNEDLSDIINNPLPSVHFKTKSLPLFPSVSASISNKPMVFPSMENNNTIPIDEIIFKPGRLTRPKNIVIIIRGPPGSGKSHIAKLIKDKEVEMGGTTPRLLSIDDYFMIENDYEEKCPKTGRRIPKKEILYEYEKEMEDTYMQYLIKSFKKTVTDHLFDFIIVDCCNQSLRTFNEFYNAARDGNFSPFIIDMICDLEVCLDQNIHNRNEDEIKDIIKNYQECPGHYIKLDVSNLLENVVEMEDVSDLEDNFVADCEVVDLNDDEDDDEANENDTGGFLKSKWDTEPTTKNLARLDGTSKPISKRGTATLEEYLQIDGWEPPTNTDGKKRVRWADIEEKRAQDKMRAIGFVVGQTDWNRMMDPTSGSGALTKTKYIERLNKRR